MTRKIMSSLMVIALAAMLIGLGTFAYFSDTETSDGNTFTAGTLVLTETGSEASSWVTPDNWAPGETEEGFTVLAHDGTIVAAMTLQINSVTLVNESTPSIAPDVIVTALTYDDVSILDDVQTALVDEGDLRLSELAVLTNFVLESGTMSPGNIGTLAAEFTYDANATVQGTSAGMEIEFGLYQTGP